MTFFRRGFAAVVVLSLVTMAGAPVRSADSSLRFEDAQGDSLDTRASMDLLAASIEMKPMAPRNTPSLVVTWELAAAPEPTGVSYEFNGELPGCGVFSAAFRPGTAYNIVFGETLGMGISTHQMYVGCGSPPSDTGSTATFVDLMTSVKGNTVTMWTALSALPKEALAEGEMSQLRAFTQMAEPATGIFGNGSLGLEPNDEATTDQVWNFA